MKVKAEIEVMLLQDKGGQRLQANHRSREGVTEQILRNSPQKEPSLLTP